MIYEYPSIELALEANKRHMASEGRQSTVINKPALEGGLARVQWAARFLDADLPTQCAYIMAGVAMAHGFEDGNKRTALSVLSAFLIKNGYKLGTTPPEAGQAVLNYVLQAHEDEEQARANFIRWIRPRIQNRF